MMDAETKKAVCARLRRIAGQVQSVERMVNGEIRDSLVTGVIDEDTYL